MIGRRGDGFWEESSVSLWSLKNTGKDAEYLFRTRAAVTCVVSDHLTISYAGSSDGSITLWDICQSTFSSSTSLSSTFPRAIEVKTLKNQIKLVRGLSFTTACSSILIIRSHPVTSSPLSREMNSQIAFPAYSFDEEGTTILWIYQKDSTSTWFINSSFSSSTPLPDLMYGMFPGSRTQLMQEAFIYVLDNEFSIETMVISSYDPFTFVLETSLGQVMRVFKYSLRGDGEQKSSPPRIHFKQGNVFQSSLHYF